jgi:hypothetical protein
MAKKQAKPGNDLMAMFEEDAPTVESLPAEKIAMVSRLAMRQAELEAEVLKLSAELKAKVEEFTQVSEKELPDAMDALGLAELKLKTGEKIGIGTFYHASIPKAMEAAAFKFLRDLGDGSDALIKNEIRVTFGKGEDKAAESFIQIVVDKGYQYSAKKFVHPQTLKAFVKERAEGGKPVPETVFGVHVQKKALISR